MTKYYRYHILLHDEYVERNLPTQESAETYAQFLVAREGYDPNTLHIEREHVPQLDGHRLGRDPDLH